MTRFWKVSLKLSLKLSIVGLGALALSCSTGRVNEFTHELGGIVPGSKSAAERQEAHAECQKLNALPSDEEEYTLGGAIALNWVDQGGGLLPLEPNAKLVRYLNVVGMNLGAQSSRPLMQWTFGILQSEESFNAISAPGGYIFVTRGLLRGVENEAQLAGVLAHEIAHVTSRHVLNRYTKLKVEECEQEGEPFNTLKKAGQRVGSSLAQKATNKLRALGKSGGGPLDLNHHIDLLTGLTDTLVDKVVNGGLDEQDEYAADAEAVRLLVSAGYDPQEYVHFLDKLPEKARVLAHHPRKADRRKRLEALLNANPENKNDFPEFAAGTEGLVQPPLPPEFASVKGPGAPGKP
jgi:hypothetical protein